MPSPIRIGKADSETIVSGIPRNPIAPNVQTIPMMTIGSGSSRHRACLNAMNSTTTISSDAIIRSGPILDFISSCIDT
uniref:Uncharacterized protein n=1 Tax=Candidatus Methanogaster sp. ANME-2c ERB4 TaxID=2759911 RepID=A0A7G9YNQ5_9EURY|nr:hypothetical protein CMAMJACB_00002 [Methanosarcinales archaeon ANME-2c ERB4]QNO49639.1 hypothetical protein CIDMNOHP_00002 [Methanosarcinales archaeon ANME-2c ERB4]